MSIENNLKSIAESLKVIAAAMEKRVSGEQTQAPQTQPQAQAPQAQAPQAQAAPPEDAHRIVDEAKMNELNNLALLVSQQRGDNGQGVMQLLGNNGMTGFAQIGGDWEKYQLILQGVRALDPRVVQ